MPDTQHNVDDAACSLVYRLKQHLGSQAHADQLSQSKYEETVQAAEVVVTEYNEDKTTAPIITIRRERTTKKENGRRRGTSPGAPPQ